MSPLDHGNIPLNQYLIALLLINSAVFHQELITCATCVTLLLI